MKFRSLIDMGHKFLKVEVPSQRNVRVIIKNLFPVFTYLVL